MRQTSGRNFCTNLAFLHLILLVLSGFSSAQLPAGELSTMNAIKSSVTQSSIWNTTDANPCNWPGVRCFVNTGTLHVNYLNIDLGPNATIAIPSLQAFTNLIALSVNGGTITARLPTDLGSLDLLTLSKVNFQWPSGPLTTPLRRLDVSESTVDSLPSLNNFAALTSLNLGTITVADNNYNFTCPAGHGIQALGFLVMNMTRFPDVFGCTNLRYLSLAAMESMTGEIPSEISALTQLTQLTLNYIPISGTLPAVISTFPLLSLYITSTNLSGPLDDNLFSSRNLSDVIIRGNSFTGPLPTKFSSSLQSLTISNNKLTGSIPQSLAELVPTSSISIDLSNNQLTGTIPKFKPYVTYLDLSKNQLTGTIPETLFNSNLTSSLGIDYTWIDVSNNRLIGTIPQSLYLQDVLWGINLANNSLSGCVEAGVAAPTDICDLSGNYFCCKSATPLCPVETNCKPCTTPKPTKSSICIVDENGNPVWMVPVTTIQPDGTVISNWVIAGDVTSISSITLNDVIIYGDLTISGDLTVNSGLIKVEGCAFANGSLTLNLTPEEIEQLTANGAITRDVIQYDALCAESSVDFKSISVNGTVTCAVLTTKQQTTPGLVSIIITATKTNCNVQQQGPQTENLPDWAIGLIVALVVVAAGVVVLAVLLARRKKIKGKEKMISSRLSAGNSATNSATVSRRDSTTI